MKRIFDQETEQETEEDDDDIYYFSSSEPNVIVKNSPYNIVVKTPLPPVPINIPSTLHSITTKPVVSISMKSILTPIDILINPVVSVSSTASSIAVSSSPVSTASVQVNSISTPIDIKTPPPVPVTVTSQLHSITTKPTASVQVNSISTPIDIKKPPPVQVTVAKIKKTKKTKQKKKEELPLKQQKFKQQFKQRSETNDEDSSDEDSSDEEENDEDEEEIKTIPIKVSSISTEIAINTTEKMIEEILNLDNIENVKNDLPFILQKEFNFDFSVKDAKTLQTIFNQRLERINTLKRYINNTYYKLQNANIYYDKKYAVLDYISKLFGDIENIKSQVKENVRLAKEKIYDNEMVSKAIIEAGGFGILKKNEKSILKIPINTSYNFDTQKHKNDDPYITVRYRTERMDQQTAQTIKVRIEYVENGILKKTWKDTTDVPLETGKIIINTKDIPESFKKGSFLLVFDNSFSIRTEKTVMYKVYVT